MIKSSLSSLAIVFVLTGCEQPSPPPETKANAAAPAPAASSAPEVEAPLPKPLPEPAPPTGDPETTIDVTGTVTFKGKLLVGCSDANPVSKPNQQPPTGFQFRSSGAGKDALGNELRLNFHNGYSKTPGEQPMGYFGEGKANASIEYQAKDSERRTSYFAIPEKTKVVLAPDLKSATVKGTFGDALNPEITIEVTAAVKCQ